MSVGISLVNEKGEAVIFADSTIGDPYTLRYADDATEKIMLLHGKDFFGTALYVGNYHIAHTIFSALQTCNLTLGERVRRLLAGGEIPYLLSTVEHAYGSGVTNLYGEYVSPMLANLERVVSVIDDPEQRGKMHKQGLDEIMERGAQFLQSDAMRCEVVVVIYDKNSCGIRQFRIMQGKARPWHEPHIEIGSGHDGANGYLVGESAGLDISNLPPEKLFFYAGCMYISATKNEGVGGSPYVVTIIPEGVKQVAPERANTLAWVCGMYLGHVFTPSEAHEYARALLSDENPPYEDIANRISMTPVSMQIIPPTHATVKKYARAFAS